MSRTPHFEIVHTNDGFTTRLVKNGRTVLSSGSQCYARKAGALRAADIADPTGQFERRFVDERVPERPLEAEIVATIGTLTTAGAATYE